MQWEKSGALGVSQDQTLFVWSTAYRGGRTSMKSQGLGVNEDVSFTVNAVDVHAVCYGFDSYNQTIEREVAQPIRSHGGATRLQR